MNSIIIETFYNSTVTLLTGFIFIKFFIEYMKAKTTVIIKQEIIKISGSLFLGFLFLTIRTIMVHLGFICHFVCLLTILEIFLSLYAVIVVYKLFSYISTVEKNIVCEKNGVLNIFSNLLAWLLFALLIWSSTLNSETIPDFVLNLRTYYLLPYSFIIFAIFFVIPKDIKIFREFRMGAFLLFLGLFSEFLARITGSFENEIIFETIFSIKFISFIILSYNIYRISFLPAKTENGCEDED